VKTKTVWAVISTSGLSSGKSLKERAKERMANRDEPAVDDFDEHLKFRTS
jgi:hypothetical protein